MRAVHQSLEGAGGPSVQGKGSRAARAEGWFYDALIRAVGAIKPDNPWLPWGERLSMLTKCKVTQHLWVLRLSKHGCRRRLLCLLMRCVDDLTWGLLLFSLAWSLWHLQRENTPPARMSCHPEAHLSYCCVILSQRYVVSCMTLSDSVWYCGSAGQRQSGWGIQLRPAYWSQSGGEQETDPGVGWRTPPRRQGQSTHKIIPEFTKQAYLDKVNC